MANQEGNVSMKPKVPMTKSRIPSSFRVTHGKSGIPPLHAMPEKLPDELPGDFLSDLDEDPGCASSEGLGDYMRSLSLEVVLKKLQVNKD